MSSPPIKQLNGHDGYLRWKESILLRSYTLGVAHVLSEDPPPAAYNDPAAAAAREKWVRDDAICRGHILATLSDSLLPDYARHATAAELWHALARTYDVDTRRVSKDRFHEFRFAEGGALLLLQQIAHAEALGAAAELSGDYVADVICQKLPEVMRAAVITSSDGNGAANMHLVWDVARRVAKIDPNPEHLWKKWNVDH
jgi:hypothetical protein